MSTQALIARDIDAVAMTACQPLCGNCRSHDLCLLGSLAEAGQYAGIPRHPRPLHKNDALYHQGEQVGSVYILRSGAVKTQRVYADGTEQVMGFYLPGEVLGFDGLASRRYCTSAIALETASVCEIPYGQLDRLLGERPDLNRRLMQLMSAEIVKEQRMISLLGLRPAEERLVAFLVDMSRRYAARGLSATCLELPMRRREIGSYLGMTFETVSRLLKRFQNAGWIAVNRRRIDLLQLPLLVSWQEGRASGNH